MNKKALITGITGQDGSYLAEYLLDKGYIVHGIKRKSSSFNTSRIDHIYKDSHLSSNLFLHYGDLTDASSLVNVLNKIKPNEIYNLAAQSHVGHSFEIPEYTSEVTGLGTLRVLEAMRFLNLKKTKFYQASTSELFGQKPNRSNSFNENSIMIPKSPYGVSKLYSYWITKVYREAYNFYACNGILFNHESPRRGETFVTRKITMFFAKKILGSKEILYLGNLNAKRDWGHAKDYTEMQWKILQQSKPDDYVIATGKTTSIREFVNLCCKYLKLKILWSGKGIKEKAYLIKNGKKELIIKIDKKYYRPLEIDYLKGNPKKALKKLNYKLKHSLKDLVKEMIDSDIKLLK
ncbi:GDP-mannose 4,6-dehydratase [Candidatus Pelagibacter communis]|uniref:GDP-mannose 4,6-dehydratase n=1 Tax=Pelagibacter ubique TaxID=198252 RepID=UPI00092D2E4D|nr:GDP-mannose 4,6-dehydratase [Candidatus Pelagibacter ubique]